MLYGKMTLAVLERQGMMSYIRRVLQDSFLKSAGPIEEQGSREKGRVQ